MWIEVRTAAFATAAASVRRVVGHNPNIPILASILIEADASGLRLTATNLDQSLTISCEAEVQGSAALAVPGESLAGLFARLDSVTTTIEVTENAATVKSGRARFRLAGLPATGFPAPLRAGENANGFALDAVDARRLFGVSFAAETEATRYYLCGTALQDLDGRLVAVATNGHLLASTSNPLSPSIALPKAGIIVPIAATNEILRLAKQNNAPLALRIDEKVIEVRTGATSFASKLIDATFPDWRRIIPEPSACTAECDREDLLAAVDRLAVIAEDRKKLAAVALQWGGGDGEIKISLGDLGVNFVEAATIGRAHVGASAAYLSATLTAINGDQIKIDSPDATLPIRIGTAGDPELIIILMPCRVEA